MLQYNTSSFSVLSPALKRRKRRYELQSNSSLAVMQIHWVESIFSLEIPREAYSEAVCCSLCAARAERLVSLTKCMWWTLAYMMVILPFYWFSLCGRTEKNEFRTPLHSYNHVFLVHLETPGGDSWSHHGGFCGSRFKTLLPWTTKLSSLAWSSAARYFVCICIAGQEYFSLTRCPFHQIFTYYLSVLVVKCPSSNVDEFNSSLYSQMPTS